MTDPNTPEPVEPWLLKVDAAVKRVKRTFTRKPAGTPAPDPKSATERSSQQAEPKSRKAGWWSTLSAAQKTMGVAVVVIVAVIGGMVATNSISSAVQEAEASAAAEKAAEEQRAADEKEAEEEKKRQEEREAERAEEGRQALIDGPQVLDDADAAIAASPWAFAADLARLTSARDELEIALRTDDPEKARIQVRAIPSLITDLGTPESAKVKVYSDLLKDVPSADTVEVVQQWCADVTAKWSSDRTTAAHWLRGTLSASKTAGITVFCPDVAGLKQAADSFISDGKRKVGEGVQAGTWRTLGQVTDCYWERSSGGGDIIENNFITLAPDGATVTVYDGEGFTVQGCGLWERVG